MSVLSGDEWEVRVGYGGVGDDRGVSLRGSS